jgi:N6-L-threonylcarbamoyladenine synthase
MIYNKDFDFSFSGLKTAVRNEWEKEKFKDEDNVRKMCAAFQQASIDVLVYKTIKAAQKYQVKSLLLGGGVAANKELRRQLAEQTAAQLPDVKFFQPDLRLTTDNALMVAVAAYFEAKGGLKQFSESWRSVKVNPNLEI